MKKLIAISALGLILTHATSHSMETQGEEQGSAIRAFCISFVMGAGFNWMFNDARVANTLGTTTTLASNIAIGRTSGIKRDYLTQGASSAAGYLLGASFSYAYKNKS